MCRTSLVAIMDCGANRVDADRWRAPGTSGVTSRHGKCGVSPPCARPPRRHRSPTPPPQRPRASSRPATLRASRPLRSGRAARNPRSRHAYCNGTPPRSAVPQWRYVARHAYRPPNLWIHRVRQARPTRRNEAASAVAAAQDGRSGAGTQSCAAGRPGRGRGITTAREIGREACHTAPPVLPSC